MDWFQILVIILSVFLAVFLILGIILIAMIIKVTKQVKSIASTAERAAAKIEGVARNIGAATSPMLIAKIVRSFIKGKRKK